MGAGLGKPRRGADNRLQHVQPPDIPPLLLRPPDWRPLLRPTLLLQAFPRVGGAHDSLREGFPAEFRRLLCGARGPGAVVPVEPGGVVFGEVYDGFRRNYRRYEGKRAAGFFVLDFFFCWFLVGLFFRFLLNHIVSRIREMTIDSRSYTVGPDLPNYDDLLFIGYLDPNWPIYNDLHVDHVDPTLPIYNGLDHLDPILPLGDGVLGL